MRISDWSSDVCSSDLEPEDLIKFGLIPEFVCRLPVVATIEELDEAALVKILTEPKNAITKQFHKLFDMEGVELEFCQRSVERSVGKECVSMCSSRCATYH